MFAPVEGAGALGVIVVDMEPDELWDILVDFQAKVDIPPSLSPARKIEVHHLDERLAESTWDNRKGPLHNTVAMVHHRDPAVPQVVWAHLHDTRESSVASMDALYVAERLDGDRVVLASYLMFKPKGFYIEALLRRVMKISVKRELRMLREVARLHRFRPAAT